MKFFVNVLFASLLFISCTRNNDLVEINLPTDSAMNDANQFALVIETYISLHDKPGDDGITVSHARRLDIFEVKGLQIIRKDNTQILWVNLGNGWIPRTSIQLYPTREKAKTASKKLK